MANKACPCGLQYKKKKKGQRNKNRTHTNLFQPLKVLPEESHGPVGPRSAQLDNAVLQQLLNVVFLHVLLTLPQAPLLLAARTSRCHDDNRNPALWPLTFVMRREKQRSLSVCVSRWYRPEIWGCEKNRAWLTKYWGKGCREVRLLKVDGHMTGSHN